MKKICLLLFATMLTISIAYAQSGWINYKIDNKVSVKLPAQPKTIDVYNVFARDSNNLVYIVGCVDLLKTDGTDSAKLVSIASTPEYATITRSKLAESMPGFELGNIKTGVWKTHTCFNLEGVYTATKAKVYMFMFIIGSQLYGLTVIVPENKSPQGKDDFVASTVLN